MATDHLAVAGVRRLAVRTEDGTDLAGLVLPARPPRPPAAGARSLAFVVAHGGSGVGGDPELPDVDAAVAAARAAGAVVTVGLSMGGGAAPARPRWAATARTLGSRVVRLRLDDPWLGRSPRRRSSSAFAQAALPSGELASSLTSPPSPPQVVGPGVTVWVVPGLGHAESGATAPLVERSGRWASATIDP